MTVTGHPENDAIRPSKNTINAAAARSEDAAKGEDEEAGGGSKDQDPPPEKEEQDEECGTCGEGIEGNEAGKRNTTRVRTPYKPSQEEVDDHDLTPLPYRSGCRHCIRARGKETSHQQQRGTDRTVPEFHMDSASQDMKSHPQNA